MDAERFLFSLSRFGIKLGLQPTISFTQKLGNPQDYFRSVHVGGSNGKGSTTTFIYRILQKKYTAGLYVSPHIRNFTERIVVSGEEISWNFIENFIKRNRTNINLNGNYVQLTFFEYTTAMAFQYFKDKNVEYAAIEVGMGGRLDSTNVITPELSVITSISMEHADKLGGNIDDIAREKGGIIKSERPVLLGRMPERAKAVLTKIAEGKKSRILDIEQTEISNIDFRLDGTSFKLKTDKDVYDVNLRALGNHQVINSTMAILAYEDIGNGISKEDAMAALASEGIPGRFEIRRTNPLIVLDGAHNSEAVRTLASNVKLYHIKNPLIVLGILRDKNSYNMLQQLSEISDRVIVTEPNERERRKTHDQLAREASFFFKDVEKFHKPESAIDAALAENTNVIITGSLYLVGEAEKILDRKFGPNSLPVESTEVNT